MHIIKITGSAGSGKTAALQTLAESHDAVVVHVSTVMSAMPLLMKKVTALGKNTFIDEVSELDMVKLQKLAKLYPATYHMYVAGVSL